MLAIGTVGPAAGQVQTEPFWGRHQAGILTARQSHTYFAAFDLETERPADLRTLLQAWTDAAARMTQGGDEAAGLAPARLTLTFGFGPSLFHREGQDRLGLAKLRPEALVDLPAFAGDQLDPARSGGDLSVQACADDPQVVFHAVRQLARIAKGVAHLRWTQAGFTPNAKAEDTPRNLMGFRDGTQNPVGVPGVVWAGDEAPAWMRGGSYMVVRRIRMALEHWDDTEVSFQEETIGRRKVSGAPLTGKSEFDALDLDAADADGNPVIAVNAHVRMAAAASNGGAQILRRAFSYNDGVNLVAERWPPWRQGLEYDAGLLFIAYQRDPRTGFIRMFAPMAKLDALNQFTTHVASGVFAVPPGVEGGRSIGEGLMGG